VIGISLLRRDLMMKRWTSFITHGSVVTASSCCRAQDASWLLMSCLMFLITTTHVAEAADDDTEECEKWLTYLLTYILIRR